MNVSGSENVTGGVDGNASVSVSGPERIMIGTATESAIGTANENGNGTESEGNKNGKSVYGGDGTRARARVRIHVLFARYCSDRNREKASDGYRDGNQEVAFRHARPSFPSENWKIIWARRVGFGWPAVDAEEVEVPSSPQPAELGLGWEGLESAEQPAGAAAAVVEEAAVAGGKGIAPTSVVSTQQHLYYYPDLQLWLLVMPVTSKSEIVLLVQGSHLT